MRVADSTKGSSRRRGGDSNSEGERADKFIHTSSEIKPFARSAVGGPTMTSETTNPPRQRERERESDTPPAEQHQTVSFHTVHQNPHSSSKVSQTRQVAKLVTDSERFGAHKNCIDLNKADVQLPPKPE